jgi:hypothetical protein
VWRSLSANDRLAPAATNMQLMARCLAKAALCNAVWPLIKMKKKKSMFHCFVIGYTMFIDYSLTSHYQPYLGGHLGKMQVNI